MVQIQCMVFLALYVFLWIESRLNLVDVFHYVCDL